MGFVDWARAILGPIIIVGGLRSIYNSFGNAEEDHDLIVGRAYGTTEAILKQRRDLRKREFWDPFYNIITASH